MVVGVKRGKEGGFWEGVVDGERLGIAKLAKGGGMEMVMDLYIDAHMRYR